jgi:dimethylargininase
MSIFSFDRAIVRAPGESAVDGLRAGDGPSPDLSALRAEHQAYVEALGAAGLVVETLPPLEQFPDSMFVEDPALVFAEGAILLRPGAASRAGEAAMLEPVLRDRFEHVATLAEGHADGGDVLVTPAAVYIGLSARTDAAGARALALLLGAMGREARVVETPRGTLHLKSGAAIVDEETMIVTASVAASGMFAGFRLLEAAEDEDGAANLIRVNDHVLAGADYPRTLELLAGEGLAVTALQVAGIAALDAGLSCMSLRWDSRAS